MSKNKKIGILVPVFNEKKNIENLFDSYIKIIDKIKKLNLYPYLIIVDDGSTDETYDYSKEKISNVDFPCISIKLRKNFGKDMAILAGLQEEEMDFYVIVDADLQTPIELTPEMIKKMQKEKVEVVNGVKSEEPYNIFRKIFTFIFYKVSKLLGIKEVKKGYSDFILFTNNVRSSLLNLKEKEFVLRSMLHWFKFKEADLYFKPKPTKKSNFSLGKLFSIAVRTLVTFSNFLRINFFLAAVYWILSIIYGGIILYNKFTDKIVTGLSSMLLLTLISFGILFFMIAILGEILKIIFIEIKQRPKYLIEKVNRYNFDKKY